MQKKLPIFKCSAVQFFYRGISHHSHFLFVVAIRVESTQKKLHTIFNTCATAAENSSENVTVCWPWEIAQEAIKEGVFLWQVDKYRF